MTARNRAAAARGAKHRDLIERYLVHAQHGRRIARPPVAAEIAAFLRIKGIRLSERTVRRYLHDVLDAELELARRVEDSV